MVVKPRIKHGHGSHRLYDRYGTGQDTRVVAATWVDGDSTTVDIHCLLRTKEGSHGFESDAEGDGLTIGDATLDATRVVGEEMGSGGLWGGGSGLWGEEIVLLTATLCDTRKTFAIFKTFHGIDRQHGSSELGMQFAKSRFTQTNRAPRDDGSNNTPYGVTLTLHLHDEFFHALCYGRVRTTHIIGLDEAEVKLRPIGVTSDVAHLLRPCLDIDAELSETKLSHGAPYHTTDGLTCRGASTATMVAQAIFSKISVVGM